jgi:hypothetical protein
VRAPRSRAGGGGGGGGAPARGAGAADAERAAAVAAATEQLGEEAMVRCCRRSLLHYPYYHLSTHHPPPISAPAHPPFHPPIRFPTLHQKKTKKTQTLVRKLRTLRRRASELAPSLVAQKARKYLLGVGARVDAAAPAPGFERAALWKAVAAVSAAEGGPSGPALEAEYERAREGGGGGGGGGEAI